jgi:hypothetical protein
MGLAFDINALKETPLRPHPELPPMPDYEGYVILKNCATVEEAMELIPSYNCDKAMWGQIHFADAQGDAVVIGAGPDKELTFTRKQRGDGMLVSTNFNVAHYPPEEREGLCWRYDTAVEMLEKIENEHDLTVDYFSSILDAVHQEGRNPTQYSTIIDLKQGDIYVFYFHQFEERVMLNVSEELSRNPEPTSLKTLFSQKIVDHAIGDYESSGLRERIKYMVMAIGIGALVEPCYLW